MTFKQFETTVNHFRNDVIVSQHGAYCNNKSENTLGIIFIKDGKESRVYNFSGTYRQILEKLGIEKIFEVEDIEFLSQRLEKLEKENGQKDDFFGDVFLIDNNEEINKVKETLKNMEEWYKIV